jgi:poly(3-hydroxybutyrate) depolymerase
MGPLEVECSPIQPVSVLNIHGDSDESIPVEGGQGYQSFARIDSHSLEHTVSVWSAINGCHPAPVIVDAGVLLTSIWEGRAKGGTLQTILIHAASHAWAGGAARRGAAREGVGCGRSRVRIWMRHRWCGISCGSARGRGGQASTMGAGAVNLSGA